MANKMLVKKITRFLIHKAQYRKTTTYEEIAIAFNLPSSGNALGGTLSPILGDIFHWCKQRGQPHLTSIVVRKSGQDAGIPGAGFWKLAMDESILDSKQFKEMVTQSYHKQVFDYWKM